MLRPSAFQWRGRHLALKFRFFGRPPVRNMKLLVVVRSCGTQCSAAERFQHVTIMCYVFSSRACKTCSAGPRQQRQAVNIGPAGLSVAQGCTSGGSRSCSGRHMVAAGEGVPMVFPCRVSHGSRPERLPAHRGPSCPSSTADTIVRKVALPDLARAARQGASARHFAGHSFICICIVSEQLCDVVEKLVCVRGFCGSIASE